MQSCLPFFHLRSAPAAFFGLAIMLLASGCGDQAAQAPKAPASVVTQLAERTPVTSAVALTGEIKARVETDLGFQLSGQIATRSVDVGDHVETGQVLATLDPAQQKADVSAATASVQSAQAQLTQANAEFARQEALLAKGFTTKSAYDNAKAQMMSAQAALTSAQASLAEAEQKLANTELRADAPGIITARNAEVGQVVAAAQAVYVLAKDGPRDAVFDVYESLLTRPPEDRAVTISLLSNPKVKTTGTLREVAPTIDQTTGTVRVKLTVADALPEMQLGAAVVGVGQFRKRNVFVLPWTAFFVEEGKPAVWIVDPQTKAAMTKPVTIDSYRTGAILLSDGLEAGDIVVTRGGQLLRPGQIVAPQTSAPGSGAEG